MDGETVRLLGVDRPGTQYKCVQTAGQIFDGPSDDASIDAIQDWGATAVRVPLNEDCWLGINGVGSAVGGKAYRDAIAAYVARLNENGLYVILDLQWSDGFYALGSCAGRKWRTRAVCMKPVPDAGHAPTFWSSVASKFKKDHAVVFDLFGEPFPDRVMPKNPAVWDCWLHGGGDCTGFGYPVAGMQTLVDAVRSSGASNVVIVGGIDFANDDSGWLTHRPVDPDGNLAASWHAYNFDRCNQQTCWGRQIAPVARVVPVVAGEIGEDDCGTSFIGKLMPWLDSHGGSYLGWAWRAESPDNPCGDHNGGLHGPALITSYDGTATPYGIGLENHLTALSAQIAARSDSRSGARPRRHHNPRRHHPRHRPHRPRHHHRPRHPRPRRHRPRHPRHHHPRPRPRHTARRGVRTCRLGCAS